MLRRFFLLSCLLIFFASCEDKKSASKNITTEASEIDPAKDSITEKAAEEEKEEPEPEKPEGPLITQKELIPFLTEYGKKNPEDKIRITTRFGEIEVELFHDTPLHRANFIFLVKHDYFDNTYFHRVSRNFVIQGGNSDRISTNEKRHYIGSYLIPSEFEAGHSHVRGAFAAAKYSEQNVSKASSPYEFYIVQPERGAHHLDNDHTVFGRVTKGMDVVDTISKVDVDKSEWPITNIHMTVEIID